MLISPIRWTRPNPIVCGLMAGPLIVVIAGIVTAVIAFNGADPVVAVAARVDRPGSATAVLPAVLGRNLAAESALRGNLKGADNGNRVDSDNSADGADSASAASTASGHDVARAQLKPRVLR